MWKAPTSEHIVLKPQLVRCEVYYLHVLGGVLVAHVAGGDVQLEVRAEILEVVVVRQLVGDILVQGHRRLVRPAPGHVPEERL